MVVSEMASLVKPLSWYENLMIGTPQESATSTRQQVAVGLLDVIKNNSYTSQTLEQTLLVVDHECLCRELESTNSPASRDRFQSTIGIAAIGDFADHLSSCLVRYINPPSHIDRELQCRALLSVLALLHLHGVQALQADAHTKWRSQINDRYQDLVWLPREPTGLSPETYHKVQCAHLLSVAAAYYAQQFVKAEPKAPILLEIANNVLQIGVIAVNIALV